MAEADEEDAKRSATSYQVPGSVFIHLGLEIEEQMYKFPSSFYPTHSLPLLQATVLVDPQEEGRKIQRSEGFPPGEAQRTCNSDQTLAPASTRVHARCDNPPPTHGKDVDENGNDDKIEEVSLILPSALEPTQRLAICRHWVAEHEVQFRLAQAEDSLAELRRVRRIRRALLTNHRTQIAGQGRRANTRSRSIIKSIQEHIDKFAQRYCAAYDALVQLEPSGQWRETYLELKEGNNRGPGKEVEEEGVGNGLYTPAWIWLSNPRGRTPSGAADPAQDATDEEVNDAMRAEWTTSFARMERWSEEAELLQEEMRRVVAFLEWKSSDWFSKREARSALVASDIGSGLDAYARKQAAVYRDLVIAFATRWLPTLVSNDLNHSWASACLQRHGISLSSLPDTGSACNPRHFKRRTVSNSKQDQLDAPPTSHSRNPPGAKNTDEDMLLDEAGPDISADATFSDVDESESEGDDDDDDDDDDDSDDYDNYDSDDYDSDDYGSDEHYDSEDSFDLDLE